MSSQHQIFLEAEQLVADSVGEVIEHWGFRKALGRVWTVLYLTGEPMSANDVCERLAMSAGSVSMTLTELQEWSVVHKVWKPGERREYFEAETDLWKMISKVIAERERFWIRGVSQRLEQASVLLKNLTNEQARSALQKTKVLLSFAQLAEHVIDRFLASRRADFSVFGVLEKPVRTAPPDRR